MADGFKIADGYVEVHGVADRRSVILAADQVTRGVSDQMTTGVAFGNLREGGRKMGAVLGEHAGPNAAKGTTEGIADHIEQGGSAGHIDRAGGSLGRLLGRSSSAPFVEHIMAEIDRRAAALSGGDGGQGGDGGYGTGDPSGGTNGRDRGRGGTGGTGGSGGTGGKGGNADVDKEGRTLGQMLAQGALSAFMSSFSNGLSGFGSTITSNPIFGTAAIAIGTGLAILAAPAFGAAFSSALLLGGGLGVIGLGAWLLKDDPKIKAAASSLGKTAKTVFVGAAQPLVEPFERSLGIFEQMLHDIAPDLTEMFTAIAPAIEPLTRGVVGFIKEALPGFIDLIKAAAPFLMDLENTLPRFGEHMGKFLSLIAESGPQASLFFRDFIHLIGLLLVWFGALIKGLTLMYGSSRTIILLLVDVFMALYRGGKWVVEQAIDLFGRLGRFLAGVWRSATGDIGGFVSFLKSLPGKAWEAVKDAPGKIKGVFSGIGGWLVDAGERLIGGLIRGIKNAIPGLSGVLDWVTGMIPDWKGPPEKDRKLLEPTGEMIMQGLGRGLKTGAQDVRSDLGQVTASLPAAASTSNTTAMGGVTINIYTAINSWSQVPDEVIAQLDRVLSRYKKAYA